jgi:hypothetical protein
MHPGERGPVPTGAEAGEDDVGRGESTQPPQPRCRGVGQDSARALIEDGGHKPVAPQRRQPGDLQNAWGDRRPPGAGDEPTDLVTGESQRERLGAADVTQLVRCEVA